MRRQVQRRPEALDESDRPIVSTLNPTEPTCPSSLVGKEGSHKGTKDLRGESRIPRTAVTERIGEREHPLTHGNFGQYAVDEMGGGLRHSPAAAGRAESTPFAREGDESIVPARVAVDTQESMREYPALEIRTDLALNEPSDRRALSSRPSQKGLELLANDFVEKGLLGLVAFVLDGGKESIGITRWSALHANASDVPRRPRREASGGTDQSPALFRFIPPLSSGTQTEPPGSRFRRSRADSSLLAGGRTGAVLRNGNNHDRLYT